MGRFKILIFVADGEGLLRHLGSFAALTGILPSASRLRFEPPPRVFLPRPYVTNKKCPDGTFSICGGWGGIRTPGSLATSAVFKTVAFDRSATYPKLLRQA